MKNELAMLPSRDEMYRAICERDTEFEGLFWVGVWTTGIFCRPGCPAKRPKLENVDFYRSVSDALAAGFRPCKRCRPMDISGAAPGWLQQLLDEVELDPCRRWTDAELKQKGLPPSRVRRWFKAHHGITFHGYLRARRLGVAMGQMSTQNESPAGAALATGFDSLSGFNDAFKKWFGDTPSTVREGALPVQITRILTPLGPMVAAADEEQLILLEFADRRMLESQLKRVQRIHQAVFSPGGNRIIRQTEVELKEYFSGQRTAFSVPFKIQGTEFQMRVWGELCKIPHGTTCSYEGLARQIGKAGGQRAVGRANGDNRLAIIIPCHRVIRSDGTLSGYGGGLWRKRWLLDHEGHEGDEKRNR